MNYPYPATPWSDASYDDTPPKSHAYLGVTQDGRAAVFEHTGEPIQYVINPAAAQKLLASWEERLARVSR